MAGANSYWVTWKDTGDGNAARASALIWGPQAQAPPQLTGMLEAGPFPDKTAATAYKNAIGTGAILPPPGTPIVGDVQAPANPLNALGDIADFFHRLTESSTWVRIGEVAAGVIILYVAIKGIGSGTAAGSAARTVTRPAKSVAKKGAVAATRGAAEPFIKAAEKRHPPPPPQPRVTYRHSTITHVKTSAPPKAKPTTGVRTHLAKAKP